MNSYDNRATFPSQICIVTGANGFTGRYVCKELSKRNIPFIALVRPNSNIANAFRRDGGRDITTFTRKVLLRDLNIFMAI